MALIGTYRYSCTYYVSGASARQLQVGPPRRMAQDHVLRMVRGLGSVQVASGGVIVETHENYAGWTVVVSMTFTATGAGVMPNTLDRAVAEGLRMSGWGHASIDTLTGSDNDGVSAWWSMGGAPFIGAFKSATRTITRGQPNETVAVAPPIPVGATVTESSAPNRQGQESPVTIDNALAAARDTVQSPVTRSVVIGVVVVAGVVAVGYTVRAFR